MDQDNRVVVLIDMDCFYCQVEEKLNPELKGKPLAVVQYNPWKGGGIIAVNYVARAKGVTRHMRGDEAKAKCPEILLPSVPCQRGKADITKYRDAGKEVALILQRYTPLLERASIDEAYLDITAPVQERLKTLKFNITSDMTPNTFALGYEDGITGFISDINGCGSDSIDFDHEHAKRLLVGAVVVSEIRAAVYEETGYTCSAGIAHNKILAKLVCGMNKPNKQTVLPKHSINILYKTLSVKKVKHLGGKFGDTVCEALRVDNMSQLLQFSEKQLQARIDEKNGTWLFNIARGIDLEPVKARFNPKSIGCCKQLRGNSAVRNLDALRKWLRDLGDEIEDRLEKDALENNRTPRQMVVSFTTQLSGRREASSSRSYNLAPDDELCGELFAAKALELLMETAEGVKPKNGETNRKLKAPIKFLGISVGKFEDHSDRQKTKKINDYFAAGTSNVAKVKDDAKQEPKVLAADVEMNKKNVGKEYIMQKFFQVTDKTQDTKDNIKEDFVQEISKDAKIPDTEAVIESTLNKQESFFAKFLNGSNKDVSKTIEEPLIQKVSDDKNDTLRPTTPLCNVVNCGEDSNDTEYSGSTINMEINKSIALFEEDPEDVARISNIRVLLNSTAKTEETEEPVQPEAETKVRNPSPNNAEIFECPECKKTVTMDMFETHSDYHLALTLREEERQRVRKEIQDKRGNNKKQVALKEDIKRRKTAEEHKNETIGSMASFLVKFDDSVPTEMCLECGKRVSVEKFAEHLDFHEAQRLNRELNQKPASSFTGNNAKRKLKTVSPVKKPKLSRVSRSIDSFFR